MAVVAVAVLVAAIDCCGVSVYDDGDDDDCGAGDVFVRMVELIVVVGVV